jgi:nitrogen fixation protein NifX
MEIETSELPALSQQAALRIALAARSLPQIELRALLGLLIQHLGAPLSEAKLSKLSPKNFRLMIHSLDTHVSRREITQALAMLTQSAISLTDAPVVVPYIPIEGPKITVAMTSNQGEMLNGHYGSCLRVLIYELNAEIYHLIDVRPIDSLLQGEARARYLLAQIHDCQLLFTLSIGGPAAARVTRANIHPVKKNTPMPAQTILTELQEVLCHNPPPWIKKIYQRQSPY